MAKRWGEPVSVGSTSASASKTVFVSTNLDTHLAMTLSYSDTVGDFIRKIMLQHEQCFPKIGAIKVHLLKVPFQGKLYHLHESDMVVSSAFEGFEGRWFLFVEASSLLEDVKEQRDLDPSVNVNLDIDGIHQQDFSLILNQILLENNLRINDDSMDQNKKLYSHNSYEARSGDGNEARSGDGMKAKKKQKVKHNLQGAGPKVSTDSFIGAGPKVSITNIFEQAERESTVIEKEEVYRHHLEDLSIRSQVSDMENLALEKYVTDRREDMASPNAPSEQVLGEQPAISTRNKRKRKKKRQQQVTNSYVPSDNAATSELGTVLEGSVLQEACEGQILGSGDHGMLNDESMLTFTGNLQNDYKEGDVKLSSKNDLLLSENDKPSDLVETTPATKVIVFCLGSIDKYPEADNSKESKSKIKKSRKSAARKQDPLDVGHDLSDPSKISSVDVEGAVPRHIEDQSTRDEIVLPQNDPKKSDYKHLDSASDIAFNVSVRDDPEGSKSGCKRKKKKKKSASKSGEDLGIQEVDPKNIGDEGLASLVEKLCGVDYADTLKVNGSKAKSGVSESGPAKNSDVKGMGKNEQVLENEDGPEVPTHEIENNFEVINATVVSMEKNNVLASEGENSSVNFRRYFVPSDDHKEAVSTDKVEGESNVIEGANKADEVKIMPPKSPENRKNSHALSSSKSKQKTNVSEKTTLTSTRKKPKRSDVKIKALNKSVEPSVTDGSKEENGSLTSSNFNYSKQITKSQEKKGLLTTPGVIFGEVSSESSGDEKRNLRSGSTTQSPSDSSSSSSSEKGSINKEHKDGKTISGSKLEDTKNMSMNMILRSSNRFKKAKLTASQSEAADTNSQQVDFVPETQPI